MATRINHQKSAQHESRPFYEKENEEAVAEHQIRTERNTVERRDSTSIQVSGGISQFNRDLLKTVVSRCQLRRLVLHSILNMFVKTQKVKFNEVDENHIVVS